MTQTLYNYIYLLVFIIGSWLLCTSYRHRKTTKEVKIKPLVKPDGWELPGSPQLTKLRQSYKNGEIDTIDFCFKFEDLFFKRKAEIKDWEEIDPWTDRLEPLVIETSSKIDNLDLRKGSMYYDTDKHQMSIVEEKKKLANQQKALVKSALDPKQKYITAIASHFDPQVGKDLYKELLQAGAITKNDYRQLIGLPKLS